MVAAFGTFGKLAYKGDDLKFQSEFMALKAELDSFKAPINHCVLYRLMRAFDGKSKTTQFQIAQDFNETDIDSPDQNLYGMVQKYCAGLAAVGDGTTHQVNMCTHCKSDSHSAGDCPKNKQQLVDKKFKTKMMRKRKSSGNRNRTGITAVNWATFARTARASTCLLQSMQ